MAPDAHALATLAPQTPAVVRLTRTARADWQPAEADPPLAAGAVVDGRYRVVTIIGEGGMGRVYEVEHLFLRRRLALKLVRRDAGTGEAAARLLQEAVLAGKVPHATVVPVFDCAALPDGQVYVAMELLRGESLEEALLRPQPAEAALRWLAELARGLAAAHRAGIVHRDVKPANLFLARASDGTVQPRILDFGLAKLLPGLAGEAASVQTQAGALMGTPFYMAPERIRGETGDARADLYGFGVILYEALTGNVPFLGDGFMEIVGRHLREAPLDPRQAAPQRRIPDALAELALTLLRKDPAARPHDGDAVAAALLAAGESAAGLVLGAEAPAPATAVTQAFGEGSTQRLEGHVGTDMSAQTAVLDGEGVGAGGSGAADGGAAGARTGLAAREGSASGAGRLSSGAGLAETADGSGVRAGSSGPAARTGSREDMSLRTSSSLAAASDLSSRTAVEEAAAAGEDKNMSSRTGFAAGWLRAVGLLLACAAGGGLVAWLVMPRAEVDAPGAIDAVAGPPVPASQVGPARFGLDAGAATKLGPEAGAAPSLTAANAAEATSGITGDAAAAGTTTTAAGAGNIPAGAGTGSAAEPEEGPPAAKKRGKKPPRKAGTTEPGPRGPGPKIKTDVYDE